MADHQFLDRVTIRRWRDVGLITHEEAAHLLTVNQTGEPEQVTEPGSSGEPYADPAPGFITTAEDYSSLAAYTRGIGNFQEDLSCCGLGLTGEAGEVADLIKKELYHKHDPQPEKVKEELGDLLWYLAWTAELYGFTLTEIMEHNIAKLQKRYPQGFDTERSRNRTI